MNDALIIATENKLKIVARIFFNVKFISYIYIVITINNKTNGKSN